MICLLSMSPEDIFLQNLRGDRHFSFLALIYPCLCSNEILMSLLTLPIRLVPTAFGCFYSKCVQKVLVRVRSFWSLILCSFISRVEQIVSKRCSGFAQ